MLSYTEKTVILPYIQTLVEMAARNEIRYAKLAKTVSDKAVDGSLAYWRAVISAYRHAYYLAGGDRDSLDSIIDRVRISVDAEGKSV